MPGYKKEKDSFLAGASKNNSDVLEDKTGRYEYLVYESGKYLKKFISDTCFALPVIKREAEVFCLKLKKEKPDEDYKIEFIDNSEKRRLREIGFGSQ